MTGAQDGSGSEAEMADFLRLRGLENEEPGPREALLDSRRHDMLGGSGEVERWKWRDANRTLLPLAEAELAGADAVLVGWPRNCS